MLAPDTPPMSPIPSTSAARTTTFADLPNDCIIDVLSFVGAGPSSSSLRDLGKALCAAPWLRELGAHAWAATVRRRWPLWAAIADAAREKRATIAEQKSNNSKAEEVEWRRQAELFELREREELAVAPLRGGAIAKKQQVVKPRHRAVLAEWLAEVSWDWSCESTVIYRAVSYLDTYMASEGVAELGKYQLLGIAALRAAMADKAAATKAAAARKAGKEEEVAAVAAAAAEKKESDGDDGAEEPASKKRRRAAAAEGDEREESPEVVVAAATEDADAASRESSPEAPVTPDVSGMGEEEEDASEAEVVSSSTAAETATAERAATATASTSGAAAEGDDDKELDPARFSHISDRAYSPQDVVDATARLVAALPASLRARAPNAKMFLRSFWYRAVAGGALSRPPSESGGGGAGGEGGDRMHVYTLASFFLQLSLLDQEGAEVAPSAAAAGALSLALEVYSSSESSSSSSSCWSACLQRYSGIDAAAVEAQRERLRRVQAGTAAPHLRAVWSSRHEAHGYPEFAAEWRLALETMKEAGEV